MTSPEVTALIPAYKAARTIERTIDSLLAQPGAPLKVIVVIDGALDDTAVRLQRYSRDRVTVIEKAQNEGAAKARNDALRAADTPYVMFVDADDFMEGPLVAGLVATLRQADADVVFGPMQILHEREGKREPRFVPPYANAEDAFVQWHREGIFVTPISVLWRTDFLRKIGGWDDNLSRNDDGELVMRALLLGARMAISDKGAGIYVKHSSESLSNRTDDMESLLRANAKLIALNSPVIDRAVQRDVFGGHYFNAAWHLYAAGQHALADEALRRARELGFGTRGPLPYRVAFALLGMRRAIRWTKILKRFRRAPLPAAPL